MKVLLGLSILLSIGQLFGANHSQKVFADKIDGQDFKSASLAQTLFLGPSKSFSAKNVVFDYANMQKSKIISYTNGKEFNGSSWWGLDLRYAFLERAKFLDRQNVGISLIDDQTRLPDGFVISRPGNIFLNTDMMGDFLIDETVKNDGCPLMICFKRHPFFMSKNISVDTINVGDDPHINFKAAFGEVKARPAKVLSDDLPGGYQFDLGKGARGHLVKNDGTTKLIVTQKLRGETLQRSFVLKKAGYFRRSLKKPEVIFSSYGAWKNDSGHLEPVEPATYGLESTIDPTNYIKKDGGAEINIALVYYGDFWGEEDLERIAPVLERRFSVATDGAVRLNILYKETMNFKHRLEDLPKFEYGHLTDKSMLQRVWYAEHLGPHVLSEGYDEFKKTSLGKKHYKNLDAILMITGAQYEGLSMQVGKVAATEQPREIAWATKGARTYVVPDEEVVDGLIHELGHIMFLGHSSPQCWRPGMTVKEKARCCENSPAKDDVMSYCRERKIDNEEMINRFSDCNLDMIQNKIAPAILSGANTNIRNRSTCN